MAKIEKIKENGFRIDLRSCSRHEAGIIKSHLANNKLDEMLQRMIRRGDVFSPECASEIIEGEGETPPA